MFDDIDMLRDGLAFLIRRHENMRRLGLPHEPTVETIMRLSNSIADTPEDRNLTSQARQLLINNQVTVWMVHAGNCRELFTTGAVEEALNYCKAQRVRPPKCPIDVECINDRKAQDLSGKKISDPAWWKQQLQDRN